MRPKQLAELVRAALEDIKALDVQMLDVRKLTALMDFMIVATGTSDRHVRSIADKVIEAVETKGVKALGVEGADSAEWVLVDLGDVVLHVMQRKVRDLYQLEKLWAIKPARTRKKKPE
jgi:ribosome-associated protein